VVLIGGDQSATLLSASSALGLSVEWSLGAQDNYKRIMRRLLLSITQTGRLAQSAKWQAGKGISSLDISAHDWLSRATLALVFTFLVFISVTGALHVALEWEQQPLDHTLLSITALLSKALFLALVVATTVTRLRPLRKAPGVEPRLSALLGTFLVTSLVLLPHVEPPPIVLAISSALIISGMFVSFMVLRWLGKSFSIMPEARRLVTQGPYALVRHPLYICEEIAVIGVFIQVASLPALFIVVIHALFQIRRMVNEEKVLKATFAEYESYAAQTPRLLPLLRFGGSMRTTVRSG
jgi:protein-S-isoprenylcysteine O-methyltransferase Ste14